MMASESLTSRLQAFQALPILFAPFWLVALNTAVATVLSIPNDWHHLLELISHFRVQNFASAILCVIIFASYRFFKVAGFMLLIAAINFAYLYPWYLTEQSHSVTVDFENTSASHELRVVHSNVHTANDDYEKFLEFVRGVDPDILVVQEVNESWVQELAVLRTEMPYGEIISREDNFGIGVLSKIPLSAIEGIDLGRARLPSLKAKFKWTDKDVTLLTTHPLPPISTEYYQYRNEQISAVAQWAQKREEANTIVIGDFNSTMWSEDYKPLVDASGLRNAAKGLGIFPTWPAALPLLMIPIDHCFVSDNFQVSNYQLGANIGSDHLPIVVDLVLN